MKLGYKIASVGLGLWFLQFMTGTIMAGGTKAGGFNVGAFLAISSWAFFVAGMIALILVSAGRAHAAALGIFFAAIGLAVYGIFSGRFGSLAGLLLVLSPLCYVAWIVWYSLLRGYMTEKKLLKTGTAVEGILTSVERTGSSIRISGRFPRYGTVLRFDVTLPDGREAHTAVHTSLSETELSNLHKGAAAVLRVDPANPSLAALEPSAETGQREGKAERTFEHKGFGASGRLVPSSAPVQVKSEDILAGGLRGTAVILQSAPVGNQKTTDGRYVFFLVLDVAVEGRSGFQIRAQYAVSQEHLRFTVPGTSLPVAVSPDNSALVAVDWAAL
jgi:hypothetical protein